MSRPTVGTSQTAPATLVAIGASLGGVGALEAVLSRLGGDHPPIVVVQHIRPYGLPFLIRHLRRSAATEVLEARDGDEVSRGGVWIAPAGRQMTIQSNGGRLRVRLSESTMSTLHCPSVDTLFFSVARVVGPRAVGVVLTGLGYDGARGLLAMRHAGAETIAQEVTSCTADSMPMRAGGMGAVRRSLSFDAIARAIGGC